MNSSFSILTSNLPFRPNQIQQTINLLNEGATIPFISRYRKEATGGLDEVEIEQIQLENKRLLELQKRKEAITDLILHGLLPR